MPVRGWQLARSASGSLHTRLLFNMLIGRLWGPLKARWEKILSKKSGKINPEIQNLIVDTRGPKIMSNRPGLFVLFFCNTDEGARHPHVVSLFNVRLLPGRPELLWASPAVYNAIPLGSYTQEKIGMPLDHIVRIRSAGLVYFRVTMALHISIADCGSLMC